MALHIKANGLMFEVEPSKGEKFTLKELQALVGGLIQPIDMTENKSMVVNEEFLLNGSPVNPVASMFIGQQIHGDVVIVNAKTQWPEMYE